MLRAKLDVNGKEIGVVRIVQVKDLGGGMRKYEFRVFVSLGAEPLEAKSGTVTHHRDNGAFVLLCKVLVEAGF